MLLVHLLIGLLFSDEVAAGVVASTRVLMPVTAEVGGFGRGSIFEGRGLLLTTMVLLMVMLVILATRVLPLLQIEVQMLHPVAIRVVLGAIVVVAPVVLVILLLTTSATLILTELGRQTVTCGYAVDGLVLRLVAVVR